MPNGIGVLECGGLQKSICNLARVRLGITKSGSPPRRPDTVWGDPESYQAGQNRHFIFRPDFLKCAEGPPTVSIPYQRQNRKKFHS